MRSRNPLPPILLTGILALTIYGVLKPNPTDMARLSGTGIHVVDGDTLRHNGETIRLAGFNTPETRNAGCDHERVAGLTAKHRLQELLTNADNVKLDLRLNSAGTPVRDRYRRQIALLLIDGTDVADILISEGHAEPYDGGVRRNWCDEWGRP